MFQNRRDFIKAALVVPMVVQADMTHARQVLKPRPPAGDLRFKVHRLSGVVEINNLMSRYQYICAEGDYSQIVGLFAVKAPLVQFEIADCGIYEGEHGLRKAVRVLEHLRGSGPGALIIQAMTTPVIEISADGDTAQGIWWSPGVETHQIQAELISQFTWYKYGVDFVYEDGAWKIWHLHHYNLFKADFDKNWGEAHRRTSGALPDGLKADKPNTDHWIYSPKLPFEYIPEPPKPYETWDKTKAYVG